MNILVVPGAEPTPARVYNPYYETGNTPVARELAEEVFGASVRQLAPYVGTLAAVSFEPLQIPGEDTVNPDRLAITSGTHTVVFTGRQIVNERFRGLKGGSIRWLYEGRTVQSLSVVSLKDVLEAGDLAQVVDTTLHEMGHNFGLKHCPEDTCTMTTRMPMRHIAEPDPGLFCAGCTNHLEITGSKEVAYNLKQG